MIEDKEDIFSYIKRQKGGFDQKFYLTLLGYASEFKEGDFSIGLAIKDQALRDHARVLLQNTSLESLYRHPIVDEELQTAIRSNVNRHVFDEISSWPLKKIKESLLLEDEAQVKYLCQGLSSDAIATLVKLMSNDELIKIGQKIYHPLPESNIGACGYLSARLQPNSPTDDPEDILMSVLSVWSYAEGDLMLGNNPVSSNKRAVLTTEMVLKDLVETFSLTKHLPWTVLAHIDIQAELEEEHNGSTSLWFQSIAGTDAGLKTFDVPLKKLISHAQKRTGRFSFYVEAGQGGDFTNGHGLADMVTLESYKDGLFVLLNKEIEKTTGKKPWSVINDVAGFIGPEVFKTKDQLLRTMLEDVVLGKMHGLTYGLDVCATLHMDVDVDGLREVYLKVMEVRPAFTMVLPYMNDPMLSYLTTGVHQLVRARAIYGFKRCDAMEEFFKRVSVLTKDGKPHPDNFGDPLHMYWQYRMAKHDLRSQEVIKKEGEEILKRVKARGVIIPKGFGKDFGDLPDELERQLKETVADAKRSLRSKLSHEFIGLVQSPLEISTLASTNSFDGCDRDLFINKPELGEKLNHQSIEAIKDLKVNKNIDVQIVVSDGLNASAITDPGHAKPYLKAIRKQLASHGFHVAKETIVVHNGRVRAGYHLGETLFGDAQDTKNRVLINVIGERPGTGHRNFSVYITASPGKIWGSACKASRVDHNITKVVSGISDTALDPVQAAKETIRIILEMLKEL